MSPRTSSSGLVNALAHATEREPDAERQAGHLLSVLMDGLRHGS